MKFLDYFKMTFSNFNKRKFRSIINIFAISVGAMLIITMVSLGSGLQNYLIGKISELNNLKHISMHDMVYQDSDDLQSKLSTPNENGDIDINNVFEKKIITQEIIDNISSRDDVESLITSYDEEVSEVVFNNKKTKDVKVAYYNKSSYLESEKQNLIETNKTNESDSDYIPLEYILAGRELNNDDTLSVVIPENTVLTTFDVKDAKSVIGKEISLKSIIPNYNDDKIFESKAVIVGVIDQRFYQPSILVTRDIMQKLKNFQSQADKISALKKDEKLKNKTADIKTNNNETKPTTDVLPIVTAEDTIVTADDTIKNVPEIIPEDKTLEERGFNTVEISAKDVNNVSAIVDYIEHDLGYSTENVQTVAETLDKILMGVKLALSLVGIIVIGIASLDVINTMIMSIYERTKKIGIMKATGASKKDIKNLFLVEGFIIGLLGGAFGTLFSLFGLSVIKQVLVIVLQNLEFSDVRFLDSIITIDVKVACITIAFSIIITTMASLYPAIKASQLDPIEALRHD